MLTVLFCERITALNTEAFEGLCMCLPPSAPFTVLFEKNISRNLFTTETAGCFTLNLARRPLVSCGEKRPLWGDGGCRKCQCVWWEARKWAINPLAGVLTFRLWSFQKDRGKPGRRQRKGTIGRQASCVLDSSRKLRTGSEGIIGAQSPFRGSLSWPLQFIGKWANSVWTAAVGEVPWK